jgi:hypothetical protein
MVRVTINVLQSLTQSVISRCLLDTLLQENSKDFLHSQLNSLLSVVYEIWNCSAYPVQIGNPLALC